MKGRTMNDAVVDKILRFIIKIKMFMMMGNDLCI